MKVSPSDPIFADVKPHIVKNFFRFHRENPHVFQLFRKYAYDLQIAGRLHYGAKAIMERIRWHVNVETRGEEFKIANNHTSCYARVLMKTYPEFEGFFATRRSPGTVYEELR